MRELLLIFNEDFLKKLYKYFIFIQIYTLIYLLIVKTIDYALPFIIALIIAFLNKPLNNKISKKLKISLKFSSIISILLTFISFFVILILFLYKFYVELKTFLLNINFNLLNIYINDIINKVQTNIKYIDKNYFYIIDSSIDNLINNLAFHAQNLMNYLLGLFLKVPSIILLVFIILLSSYFISIEIYNYDINLDYIFNENISKKIKKVYNEFKIAIFNYIKSYFYIYLITFILVLLSLTLLNVKYAFLLSILALILDLVPFIGISSVFMPLAIYNYIIGLKFKALLTIICYAMIFTTRQILEPKLLSENLNLKPIYVIFSIFIGFKLGGVYGIFYLLFMFIMLNIIKKIHIQ